MIAGEYRVIQKVKLRTQLLCVPFLVEKLK
jgi:hypothetical protein